MSFDEDFNNCNGDLKVTVRYGRYTCNIPISNPNNFLLVLMKLNSQTSENRQLSQLGFMKIIF